ncbi:MAG: hypothetical protein KGJ02_01760 [Verrucomicrobiota bacterium]|nr:hypothetical protein [Verrucomicrobiota bacterium]
MTSMTTEVSNTTTENIASLPNFFEGELKVGDNVYTIRPLLPSERKEYIQFTTIFSAPYLRDGKPYQMEQATQRADLLIRRHLKGDPWSAYLIREKGKEGIKGLWSFGYDDEKGVILLSAAMSDSGKRIGRAAWNWTLAKLIPEMDRRGVTAGEVSLREATLRVIAHPESSLAKSGHLEEAGFKRKEELVNPDYVGGGPRGEYNLPLTIILGSKT